jgi:uncharacterized phosphosugar-binding protein
MGVLVFVVTVGKIECTRLDAQAATRLGQVESRCAAPYAVQAAGPRGGERMYMDQYLGAAETLLRRIRDEQYDAIQRAGVLVAASMRQQGAICVMDTGHLLQHEAFLRAGGFASFAPISFEMRLDNPIGGRVDPLPDPLTIMAEVALALDRSRLRRGDVVIINSNSGRSARVIETAIQCHERGIVTVGIASAEQMRRCAPVHPSEKKLARVVDIFIDNCTPYGDALVPVKENEAMCPGSGIAAAHILWAIQSMAVYVLEQDGLKPTIFRSVHLSGEEHLEAQRDAYREHRL